MGVDRVRYNQKRLSMPITTRFRVPTIHERTTHQYGSKFLDTCWWCVEEVVAPVGHAAS